LLTEQTFDFVSSNQALLDEVRGLWEKLNEYMSACSVGFKQHYLSITFDKRKCTLLQKATKGEMRVDISIDKQTNQKIGYCVSSIDEARIGEIDSIFVTEAYRGLGVGGNLMFRALDWMDKRGAEKKIVAVGVGNEATFGFYSPFGFCPRKTVLEQKKS
jgi:diamine N-acetyltransferase